ncbi:MAG: hypothetical protein CML13_15380 [Puniceicoccaceae bacterium]|nr:hypothetical protein [Puniceicoccaceae bacterium]
MVLKSTSLRLTPPQVTNSSFPDLQITLVKSNLFDKFGIMKKAILYSRYSSAQQSRGDTMRRQTEKGKAYAEKLGLELVEVTDRGVSAFKKKNNANSGNLSTLLTSAEAGLIPAGTVLIVERLDRVSRQTPLDALEIFKRLLYAGLEIHTLIDRQIYTRESVDRDFFQLLGSLFVMQRAYEESRTKSERIKSSVKSRKKAVLEEGKLWRGSMPHWTRIGDDNKIAIAENAANVVQRIFHLYLKGNGVSKICKLLNAEGIKSARGVKWEVKVMQDLLANPAVYGLFRIDGQEVENYYPQIISKEDFNRVQLQRARNTTTRGRRSVNHQNVFSGLLKCGNSLYYTQMGSPSRNEQRYHTFRCGTKRNGSCDNSSLKFETFRTIFFEWFKDIDYRALNETEDEMSGLEKLKQYRESLDGERVQLDEREENYVDAIGRGQQIGIYTKKVDELHLERENLLKLTKDVDQQILVLENEEPLAPVELDGYEDFEQEQNEKLT